MFSAFCITLNYSFDLRTDVRPREVGGGYYNASYADRALYVFEL